MYRCFFNECHSRSLGVLVTLIGGTALAGWIFGLPWLTGADPAAPTLKPNTAATFILAGLGLVFFHARRPRLARFSATLAGLIGALSLVEYLFAIDLGIDKLLFDVPPEPAQATFPGRMAPATALNFLLAGLSLSSLGFRRDSLGQFLALPVLFSALFSLVGHVYDAEALHAFFPVQSVSLYTALAFLALAAGLLLAVPDRGWMAELTGPDMGAQTARRLLPYIVVVPALLGWLRLQGQRMGLYGTEVGLMLYAVMNIAVLATALYRHAHTLNRADARRTRAEAALRASEEKYHSLIEHIPDAVWSADRCGKLAFISRCAFETCRICGYTSEEIQDAGGHPHFSIIHPDDAGRVGEAYAALFEQGRRYDIEYRIQTRQGRWRWIRDRAVATYEKDGVWYADGLFSDITARKEAELALAESEARFRWLFDCDMIGIGEWEKAGKIANANDALLRMVGYARDDVEAGRLDWRALTPPEFIPQDEENLKILAEHGVIVPFEKEYLHKDGHRVPILLGGATYPGQPERGVFFVLDLTERKRAEAQARKLALAIEHSPSAVLVTDRDARIEYANPKFYRLTGYAPEEVIGRTPKLLQSGMTSVTTYRDLWETILSGQEWHGELHDRKKNGDIYWCLQSISPLQNERGEITHFIAVTEDISERVQSQEVIRHLAYYDPLTDLPNRILFHDRLEQAIAGVGRSSGMFALFYLDLDHFKNINDTLGHPVGDQLLKSVASRMRGRFRDTDTVARLGGDEFAVILHGIRNAEDAGHMARQLIDSFRRPFALESHQVFTAPSIGISLCPHDGADADSLIKSADIALYRVKESGRNHFRFFTQDMQTEIMERLNLESDLRLALERGELSLHYQPQVSLASGDLIGMEALLRWRHPERGAIPPDRFIPVAEDSGLIVLLGEWVLRTACFQNRAWQDAFGPGPVVAVNLSARQLRETDFVNTVARALEDSGLHARYLEIELTESLLMHDMESVLNILRGLKNLGVRLSIDDFGTGYSNLAYLNRFPLDKIKIDKSFIRELAQDGGMIARSVIALGHGMGLTVIAEGVETAEQLAFLHEHGCDEMQGYYFSRPLDVAAFAKWLEEPQRLCLPDAGT